MIASLSDLLQACRRQAIVLALPIFALTAFAQNASATEVAVFAGGCFWCTEADFDKVPGVLRTTSGYAGGTEPAPTYEIVSSGRTAYLEAVQVEFDPGIVSYAQLLEKFWPTIDPTVPDRQFCDVGPQYRSAIFYKDEAQRQIAERSKASLIASKRVDAVYTEILPVKSFHAAEPYHQNYYQNNPIRYKYYRSRCGRDERLKMIWMR